VTSIGVESLPQPHGVRRTVVAGLIALAAVAVAGGVTGVRSLTGGPVASTVATPAAVAASAHQGVHKVGDEIPTGFGWVAAETVQKSSGVTSQSVGGNTHFPSFVGADKVQIQVTLNIRNSLGARHEVRADQFSVLAGKKRYLPGGATAAAMQIQPDASVGQILSYTVPRTNQPLTMEFAETPGADPIKIGLGRSQAMVEGASPGPQGGAAGGHGHSSSAGGTP
jgi:hypothetical protein